MGSRPIEPAGCASNSQRSESSRVSLPSFHQLRFSANFLVDHTRGITLCWPFAHRPAALRSRQSDTGEVAEWSNAHDWKSCVVARQPRVRIPPSPPVFPYQEPLGLRLFFCRPLSHSEKRNRRFIAPEISSRFEGPAKRQNARQKRSRQSAVKFLSVSFSQNLRHYPQIRNAPW